MYTLYYLPGACSLATQVVIHELGQSVNIVDKRQVADFNKINATGAVPVLVDGGNTLKEGAAIMLYLLNKHKNSLLPSLGEKREQGIEDIMFANATMHPAYSRLFFIANNIVDEKAKQSAFEAAAESITRLWDVVEQKLEKHAFLGGDQPSAADIMLAVYSRWGVSFPVGIALGPNTRKMVDAIQSMPSFQSALTAEQLQSAA